MKKLLTFSLLLTTLLTFSQTTICGEDQQKILDYFKFPINNPNSLPQTYDATTKYVFNVRYHVVYNNDGITRTNYLGVPGIAIGESEVLESIKNLNTTFNQFNIFFKYYGFDQVNDSNYLVIEDNNEFNQLINSEYSLPEAINIYIINGQVSGAVARIYIFDDNWFVDAWTQRHEMGHFFSLVHPNFLGASGCQNWEHSPRTLIVYPGGGTNGFNADVRGDQVVDTHVEVNDIYLDSNCNYIGGGVDCMGIPVEIVDLNGFLIKPGYNNLMYAPGSSVSCNDPIFTPGQGRRMREAIVGYWANSYNAQMNSIESLYQPFDQKVVAGEIVSSVDDPENGGVNVCRKIKVKLRFQPGFYTEFSDTEYGTIIQNEYQQFNYDDKLDHSIGVRIPVLDDSQIIKTAPVSSLLPFFCSFEPYTSGTLLSTEILGSMNITIKELDEIQVKDPKLYDSLMEKYYYILKQRTESGIEKEKVFYKP